MTGTIILYVIGALVGLGAFYFIIKTAVKHGVEDAYENIIKFRKEQEEENADSSE